MWVHARALGWWSEGEGKEVSQGSKIKKQRIPLLVANHSWPDKEEGSGDKARDREKRLSGRSQVAGGLRDVFTGTDPLWRGHTEKGMGICLSKGREVGREGGLWGGEGML